MKSVLVKRLTPFLEMDRIKEHLIVEHDDDDLLIEEYARAALLYCENYTRRTIELSLMRAGFDSFDECLELIRPPTRTIESVSYTDQDGNIQSLDSAAFEIDIMSEFGRLFPANQWPSTKSGINRVIIDYTAGYGLLSEYDPGYDYDYPIVFAGTDGEDMDSAANTLRIAMYLMIGHWYEHREAVVTTATGKLPMGVESILSQYVCIRA